MARGCSGFRRDLALPEMGQRSFYQRVLSAGSAPFGRSEESYCSGRGSFSKRAPREQDPSVFLYNFLKRPGYAKRPWFLVTRCLIVYYELLTYCCLGVGNGCGTITALSQATSKL